MYIYNIWFLSKAGPAKVTKFQGEQYFSLREFQNNTFDIIRKFENKKSFRETR